MSKKIHYIDEDGNELKRVGIYFEIRYTGETFEMFITVPKNCEQNNASSFSLIPHSLQNILIYLLTQNHPE